MASIVRYSTGQPTPVLGKEAAAQTFKEGDLVYFDSDGLVAVSTAGNIDGIARKDASGTTSAEIPVELIELDAVYVATYKAAATDQTIVGTVLDFAFTIGAHVLGDGTDTTDALVVGIHPNSTIGSNSQKILFRFKPTLAG